MERARTKKIWGELVFAEEKPNPGAKKIRMKKQKKKDRPAVNG